MSNHTFNVVVAITSMVLMVAAGVVAFTASGRVAWWLAFASWWVIVTASEPRRKF